MRFAGFFLALFIAPTIVFAQENAVSRRDGFLMIWNSIQRAMVESREKPFADVPAESEGSLAITYAKYRGIVDDDDANFHPNDPLSLSDALLWLYRTRSVDDIEHLTTENLPNLLGRYPLGDFIYNSAAAEPPRIIDRSITADELTDLMRKLDENLRNEEHEVSLYAEKFHGDGTAFGETFDMHALTAAHRTFPHNTLVRVTNVDNQKSVIVRINDRGPYVEGRDMDLSLGAFTSIAERSKGKIMARFERLGDATLAQTCGDVPQRFQQRLSRSIRFQRGVPHMFALGGALTLKANDVFVVRGVTFPDGTRIRLQDFVLKDEAFEFTPLIPGDYEFRFGLISGRSRVMKMKVEACS
ncbi:hypothetical protein A3D88_01035 [Candidatus Peribacteria bacterium RIFCSPHIGHO2_02_FULL_52_16]|nr:MAG: hypothetical protein A2706_05680 [Candidatus Peribacteria bacterium RIFCSPHIGHO2_01_FULL_51_35]OGJ61251.1 MAG: hypothetical protein A3D88_01035 [Candidatus Peribacteria bacterium RIFCSPHIGHO2_02_FULL_52_16]